MWAIATQINIYMIFCVCACVYARYTQQCNSSSCLFLSFCSLLPFFLLLSDFLFLWLYILTHCLPRIYCSLFFVMLKWLSAVRVCPSRIKHSYTSSFSHTSWTGIFPSSSVHWFGVAVSMATQHPDGPIKSMCQIGNTWNTFSFGNLLVIQIVLAQHTVCSYMHASSHTIFTHALR